MTTTDTDLNKRIANTELTLHPELLAAAIQKDVLDLFIIWVIMKTIDGNNTGRGLIKYYKLHNMVCGILGYKERYAYTKIKRCENIFWSSPSGSKGDRQIVLISKRKVYDWLDPDMTQVQPFVKRIGEFLPVMISDNRSEERGPAKLKRLALEMIIARHTNDRPVSYESVAHSAGLCRRTVIRYIKESCSTTGGHLQKTANFAKIFSSCYPEETIQMFQALRKTAAPGSMPYRFAKQNGNFLVVQQQGNTYYLANQTRLPLHKRSELLKMRDASNGCKTAPRLYCTTPKHIILSTTSPQYFKPSGIGHVYNIGRVKLWQSVGKANLPKILTANVELYQEHIYPWIQLHLKELKN